MTERKYETETMIKLYLYGEHVGYKHSLMVGLSLGDYLLDKEFQTVLPYEYDSFRHGIKLPDGKGWLFDGDKVKQMRESLIDAVPIMGGRRIGLGTGYQTKTAVGTLHCDNYGWSIKDDNPSSVESRHMFGGIIWTWEELTPVTGRWSIEKKEE